MKSLWNWAEVVQGWDGGTSGTDSSSGSVSWSSPPSPNPSVPVKASRSGDPIIFNPWRSNQRRHLSPVWSGIVTSRCRRPGGLRPVSQLFGRCNNNNRTVLKTSGGAAEQSANQTTNASKTLLALYFPSTSTVAQTSGVFGNRLRRHNGEARFPCGRPVTRWDLCFPFFAISERTFALELVPPRHAVCR